MITCTHSWLACLGLTLLMRRMIVHTVNKPTQPPRTIIQIFVPDLIGFYRKRLAVRKQVRQNVAMAQHRAVRFALR